MRQGIPALPARPLPVHSRHWQTGRAERALNFYQEMRAKSLQLTEKTFNALIHACARRLEYRTASLLQRGHPLVP